MGFKQVWRDRDNIMSPHRVNIDQVSLTYEELEYLVDQWVYPIPCILLGMPVEVVSYNPEWSQWFKEITEPIWEKLCNNIADIVHIGSTSIEGMTAKPCIDIDIVVDDWDHFQDITIQLNQLGYHHIGNLGIKEREAFKYEKAKYRHNLYVCKKDSIAYRNHTLLKKHLLENPEDFERYKTLKQSLGKTSANIDEYCRRKTELILEFLKAEGVSEEDLEEIRVENLS